MNLCHSSSNVNVKFYFVCRECKIQRFTSQRSAPCLSCIYKYPPNTHSNFYLPSMAATQAAFTVLGGGGGCKPVLNPTPGKGMMGRAELGPRERNSQPKVAALLKITFSHPLPRQLTEGGRGGGGGEGRGSQPTSPPLSLRRSSGTSPLSEVFP